jgi:hypothetical protein
MGRTAVEQAVLGKFPLLFPRRLARMFLLSAFIVLFLFATGVIPNVRG